MKLSLTSLLALCATVAISTPQVAFAAECTEVQLAAFGAVSADDAAFEKACSDIVTNSESPIDPTTLAGLNPCGSASCVAYIKKLAGQVPDCEIVGVSLRASFDVILALCDGKLIGGTGVPAVTPTGLPTTTGSGSDSKTPTTTEPTTIETSAPSPTTADVSANKSPSPAPTSSALQTSQATAAVTITVTTMAAAWLATA